MKLQFVDKLLGKKRVFVGSSTEGHNFAEKVRVELKNRGLSPLPW